MLVSTIPGDGLQGVILETSVWILEIGLINTVCVQMHMRLVYAYILMHQLPHLEIAVPQVPTHMTPAAPQSS